jgi:galactose mutarotase-like enzyme
MKRGSMTTYKISNEWLSVKINLLGAELQSIENVKDHYEYLWQGNPEYWSRKAPVLFPIVGKLLDDEYYVDEKIYNMKQHGFARDHVFTLYSQDQNSLAFELKETKDTLEHYPYKFSLIIKYTLEKNNLTISYKVSNFSEKTMPFSIGGHPAFNMTQNSYLVFNERQLKSYQVESRGINKKEKIIELQKGQLPLKQSTFEKDALIFKDIYDVKFVQENHSIHLLCDGFPYLGVWSKPSGAPFVCLEPWYGLGDLIDHDKNIYHKEGINTLDSKQNFNCNYTLKFS